MIIEKYDDLKQHYDVIVVADYLVKYKTRLYTEIQKEKSVLVIYDKHNNPERKMDFYDFGPHTFDTYFITGSRFAKISKLKELKKLIKNSTLIISGWTEVLPIYSILRLRAKRKCVIAESGIYESTLTGPKAWLKKFFLRKIDVAFVPGIANKQLLDFYKFKGKIVQTHGVGLFNRVAQVPYEEKKEVRNFLYVGRIIELKNLRNLINVFSELPQFNLTLAGDGELLDELKNRATENVKFLGAVPNVELPELYKQNDVFILPSFRETWGLVLEEALNNGIPFIVSNHVCGGVDFLERSKVGLSFDLNIADDLKNKILKISNIELYNQLRKNVCSLDFAQIEQNQVKSFVDNII